MNVLSLLSSWLLQLCLLLLSAGWWGDLYRLVVSWITITSYCSSVVVCTYVRAIVRSILSDRELNGIVITFSVYLVFGLADAVCLNRSQVTIAGSTHSYCMVLLR